MAAPSVKKYQSRAPLRAETITLAATGNQAFCGWTVEVSLVVASALVPLRHRDVHQSQTGRQVPSTLYWQLRKKLSLEL
jgi:hypothetical protein